MGWPPWTVHYSQGKGITQTFPIALHMCTARLVLITEQLQGLLLQRVPLQRCFCLGIKLLGDVGAVGTLFSLQVDKMRQSIRIQPDHCSIQCDRIVSHRRGRGCGFVFISSFPSLSESVSHRLENFGVPIGCAASVWFGMFLLCTWCIVIAHIPQAAIGTLSLR